MVSREVQHKATCRSDKASADLDQLQSQRANLGPHLVAVRDPAAQLLYAVDASNQLG
jgi:hypothetical protein